MLLSPSWASRNSWRFKPVMRSDSLMVATTAVVGVDSSISVRCVLLPHCRQGILERASAIEVSATRSVDYFEVVLLELF